MSLQTAVGTYGWQALRIANIGIFMINYSLNEFAHAAFSSRERMWRNRYREYNEQHNRYRQSTQRWADFIVENVENSRDFKTVLENRVNLYLNDYFGEAGSACPEEVEQVIVAEEKHAVYETLHKAVQAARVKMRHNRERDILRHIMETENLLNRNMSVWVSVYGDSAGDPRVNNLTVVVPVSRDQNLWRGETDESGQWILPVTVCGLYYYGLPRNLQVQTPDSTYTEDLEYSPSGIGVVRIYLDSDEEVQEEIIFDLDLTDGQVFRDSLITVTGSISVCDSTGSMSPYQGPGAAMRINETFYDLTLTGGRFAQQVTLPLGRNVLALYATDGQGTEYTSDPITIIGEFDSEGEGPGILHVSSQPPGASITIDGYVTGRITQTEFHDMEPGTYDLMLTLGGYEDYSGTATIISGQTTAVNVVLEPGDQQQPQDTSAEDRHYSGTFTIPAGGSWSGSFFSTGVDVSPGQVITFSSSGSVKPSAGRDIVAGPDGTTAIVSWQETYSYNPSWPHEAVVGRIGGGEIFLIGSGYQHTAAEGGTLELGVNDTDPGNNDGSFQVQFSW